MPRPVPDSRIARPRLVALKSGLYSVRFRGVVVFSRVSRAAAEEFASKFVTDSIREYRPVAGVSHSERCRAYRARLAAARAASAPLETGSAAAREDAAAVSAAVLAFRAAGCPAPAPVLVPAPPAPRSALPLVLAALVLALILALPGSALASLAAALPPLSGSPLAFPRPAASAAALASVLALALPARCLGRV